jgi:phenylalanyl-tRNA synthetase alpha chain
MKEKIEKIKQEVEAAISRASTLEELKLVHAEHFSKKGTLTALMSELGKVSPEEKPKMGLALNELKTHLQEKFDSKQNNLGRAELDARLANEKIDITAPGKAYKRGHIHPLSQIQKEVEEIFMSMGFTVEDGPEVESEYFNFDALNIPATHPARDMQDTFFVKKDADKELGRMVLRTQTSPVQIRTMQKQGAPLRIIVPGRVFRYEATDASHDTTFYQVEGLLIDKDISLAHLKGILKEFLSKLFGKEVVIRFRPGYFPFVEPGIEMDFGCLICNQKGCRVCKNSGWVEFMGAGMVHQNVLRAGGIDPNEYQGWAFGFGLTRLVMMRYQITDIRLLFGGDTRFLNQF